MDRAWLEGLLVEETRARDALTGPACEDLKPRSMALKNSVVPFEASSLLAEVLALCTGWVITRAGLRSSADGLQAPEACQGCRTWAAR